MRPDGHDLWYADLMMPWRATTLSFYGKNDACIKRIVKDKTVEIRYFLPDCEGNLRIDNEMGTAAQRPISPEQGGIPSSLDFLSCYEFD